MKIGFITLKDHNKIAGTERVLLTILKELEKRGLETKCYFISDIENKEFINQITEYEIAYIPKFLRKKHILRPRALYKIMRKRGINQLFKKIGEDNLDALFVLKIEDEFIKNHQNFVQLKSECPILKVIAWPHCDLKKIISRTPNLREKLSIFDAFYAISDGIATDLSKTLSCNNILKIYNPVESGPAIPRKKNHFLYIGRIDNDKRVKELLQTLDKLQYKNWHLDIIGSAGTKKENIEFQSFINTLSTSSNITFHGWSSNPWDLVKGADLLLLNSRTEGCPLVLIEAIMRGVPCISTDCPSGPASIIKNGVNGWLVDLHDEQQLIVLLESILSQKKELPPADQVIQSAEKFSTDNVVNHFLSGLKELSK